MAKQKTKVKVGLAATRWLVEIQGEKLDLNEVDQQFRDFTEFWTEEHLGKKYIVAPQFQVHGTPKKVHQEAAELLEKINSALEIVMSNHRPIQIGVVSERASDGKFLNHHLLAVGTATMRWRGHAVGMLVGGAPQPPQPTLAEKIMFVMCTYPDIAAGIQEFNCPPPTWSKIRNLYETAKKCTGGAKADWQPMVAWGWMTDEEANRLYDSATYHCHGHPRSPLKYPELSMAEAIRITRRLVSKLCEKLWQGQNE